MEIALGPEAGQFEELMRGPADTPVVMLNLLKFKARAEIPGEEVSGQEAYGRYAAEMRKGVEAAGGRTQGLEGQWLLATTEASI